jgi:hypothetical protein
MQGDRPAQVLRATGYVEYAMWIDTGMSFERKKASLERFIAEVMPAFARCPKGAIRKRSIRSNALSFVLGIKGYARVLRTREATFGHWRSVAELDPRENPSVILHRRSLRPHLDLP